MVRLIRDAVLVGAFAFSLIFTGSLAALESGCATAPPLGPVAAQDFQKTRVIKALDLFRNFAIDGEAARPQAVSTDLARKVVTYHQAALKILDAAGSDWRTLTATSLDAFVATLAPAERTKIAPYVALTKTILTEIQ